MPSTLSIVRARRQQEATAFVVHVACTEHEGYIERYGDGEYCRHCGEVLEPCTPGRGELDLAFANGEIEPDEYYERCAALYPPREVRGPDDSVLAAAVAQQTIAREIREEAMRPAAYDPHDEVDGEIEDYDNEDYDPDPLLEEELATSAAENYLRRRKTTAQHAMSLPIISLDTLERWEMLDDEEIERHEQWIEHCEAMAAICETGPIVEEGDEIHDKLMGFLPHEELYDALLRRHCHVVGVQTNPGDNGPAEWVMVQYDDDGKREILAGNRVLSLIDPGYCDEIRDAEAGHP